MQTKTKQNILRDTDGLEISHPFSIPEDIKQKVRERGFYLYEWIDPTELKATIERDFLKVLTIVGIPIAILGGIMGFMFSGNLGSLLAIFGFLMGIMGTMILLYVFVISIIRSRLLLQGSHVVITDSAVSLGGKIVSYENIGEIEGIIDSISHTFEEKLFNPSMLMQTKTTLFAGVFQSLMKGYRFIFEKTKGHRGGKQGNIILIMLLLYTVYALVMGGIYFIGIFIIWMIGLAIVAVNRFMLRMVGHKVTVINGLFNHILQASIGLKQDKKDLQALLSDATQNDWKDSLLTKIQSEIDGLNNNASDAIDVSKKLRSTIETSKYSDMFNFGIYNNWIKDQIITPIIDIRDLLVQNVLILEKTKQQLIIQIQQTDNPSLQGPLKLQEKRLVSQIQQIHTTGELLQSYIQKLT